MGRNQSPQIAPGARIMLSIIRVIRASMIVKGVLILIFLSSLEQQA